VPHHLLVCATNWVARLDSAFLRPGRFDYVLPVGPPTADARRPIWRRYAEEITDEEIDLEALVRASELFTPADIEFAARKAAPRAFEREHFQGSRRRAQTEDFLAAIADNCRPRSWRCGTGSAAEASFPHRGRRVARAGLCPSFVLSSTASAGMR
jgi:SpoVK/Ycf46/Vps4 family AAA+-type ATPase